MKSEWAETQLSDVAELTVGFVGPMVNEYRDSGVKFIRSMNVHPFKIDFSEIKYISEEFNAKISKSQLQANDVVIVRTGQPGASAVIPEGIGSLNCSDLVIIHPDQNKIDPLFLAAYINLSSGLIASNLVGAVQQHFNVGSAKKMLIRMPDLETQKKISTVINTITDKIETNNRINDNLEQQADAVFDDLFTAHRDPSWHEGTISDLGTVVGGSTPSKAKPEYYTDHGIAWVTPKDLSIDKSKFITHGADDITELGLRNSSASIMPKGTVLFSSRAPIGYIAIADGEVTTNQGFKSVVPHANIGTPYIYYFLKNALPVIENMASGSTFKEISGTAMKNVPAIIPDNDTLQRFTAFCEPLFQQQRILELQNRELTALRDILLPRLMSGEIDVSGIAV